MNETIDQKTAYSGFPQESKTLPNATATLVLGIISIVLCFPGFILGTIALVLHKSDKALYLSNPEVYAQSYKNARAGFVCAIVGICLSVFVILFYVLWFIFVFSMISEAAQLPRY